MGLFDSITSFLDPGGFLFGNSGGGGGNQASIDAINDAATKAQQAANDAATKSAEAIAEAIRLAQEGNMEMAEMAAEEARISQERSIAFMKEATANAQKILTETEGRAGAEIDNYRANAEAVLREYTGKAAEYLKPYAVAGEQALSDLQALTKQGVRLVSGGQVLSGDQQGLPEGLSAAGGNIYFDEKTGQYVGGGSASTGDTTGTYDITQSPYYGLYQFQKQQQDKAVQQALAARGLYDSGYGIGQQVKADTGLAESMAATEYQRAVEDYLRKSGNLTTLLNSGQGASTNLANLYSNLGANLGSLNQWAGGSKSNLISGIGTAKANAEMQQGTNLSNISQNTGQLVANILSNAGVNNANMTMTGGTTQANIYGNLGNTLANIYANQGTNLANLYNQSAQNRQNMFSGLANTGLYSLFRFGKFGNNAPSVENAGQNGIDLFGYGWM